MFEQIRTFVVVSSLMSLAGCASYSNQGTPVGLLYTGTRAPSTLDRAEVTGAGKTGAKSGEACSNGILGLVAWGDSSVDAAKKAGQISSVHSVEYGATGVLGFVYTQTCTVVHGD